MPDHDSDCALHNEPAYPKGACDCSAPIKTYKPNDTARIEAMLFETARPVVSEAMSWAGIENFRAKAPSFAAGVTYQVRTLEGWVDMPYGSYLAKDKNDEFYPIDPDVFANRWVEVRG